MNLRSIASVSMAVCAAAFCAAEARADTVIDTSPSWNQTHQLGNIGESGQNIATVGQTFLVGSDTVLNSFSFWVDDNMNSDALDYAAYVMEWTGTKATGSVLYQSAASTTTNNGGSGGWEKITFSTGGTQS